MPLVGDNAVAVTGLMSSNADKIARDRIVVGSLTLNPDTVQQIASDDIEFKIVMGPI